MGGGDVLQLLQYRPVSMMQTLMVESPIVVFHAFGALIIFIMFDILS